MAQQSLKRIGYYFIGRINNMLKGTIFLIVWILLMLWWASFFDNESNPYEQNSFDYNDGCYIDGHPLYTDC